jgi:hypothetical protein
MPLLCRPGRARFEELLGDETKRQDPRFRFMTLRVESSLAMSGSRRVREVDDLFDRARRKLLRKFPGGFRDETYLAWERDYKWEAHREWADALAAEKFRKFLRQRLYLDIAAKAVKIESGRSLLFLFEKMALRDAVRSEAGAKIFAEGLFVFLHGKDGPEQRFDHWVSGHHLRLYRAAGQPYLSQAQHDQRGSSQAGTGV